VSGSSISFAAEFAIELEAIRVKEILDSVHETIASSEEELYVHNVLEELDEGIDIEFDSMWYPQSIELVGSTIYVDLVGSPSETSEQDIITWIKAAGAIEVSGKAIFDGGGDIYEEEF
jgi:hypothetical protein